ncbi:MAG: hypothetical protein GVY16_01935, partial [Planctomycetes bacterium]|nr:hypothetical protein [Planctomycetota bacterium]
MKKVAILTIMALFMAATAQAATIGVNFVNYQVGAQNNQSGYVLLPTEEAGVEAQENWNNYSRSNDTTGRIEWDPDAGTSGEWVRDTTDPTYIDSDGNDTDLDISWDVAGWDVFSSYYGATSGSDGDTKLMSGNMLGVNDISLSNVPYTTYDLIVYVAGQSGQDADQSVTVSGDDFTDITKYVTKASGSTT